MLNKLYIIILSCLLAFLLGTNVAFSQSYWEAQTNITGYISSEFNYFDNLNGFDNDYGAAVAEAGILVTYQPSQNFTIKSVFVYRPGYEFDLMLNEAFGELYIADALKFKVGRFLTPLSPMNTYYYAPVNISATLPIIVSNNENFPLNIDGVSLNGSVGEDFKIKYEAFAGGYTNSTWRPSGAVGFFGREVPYFKDQTNSQNTIDESYQGTYNVGVGGRAGVAYKSLIELNAGFFRPKKETLPISVRLPENALFPGSPSTEVVTPTGFERPVWGFNGKFHYENTIINAEYWTGDLSTDPLLFDFTGAGNPTVLSPGGDVDLEGLFVQVSHGINQFTPYARYEFQKADDITYRRYSAGLNYKPSFTRTVKLEYVHYVHTSGNINGLVAALIYSF